MQLSTVFSRAQHGIDAPLVRVETHISNGLPAFSIVGLPATAVRESKDRVRSALINSHFDWPERRLTVNLAPADLPKEGGRFDLPIALGILAASGQLPEQSVAGREFLGELALSGDLRAIAGTVSAAISSAAEQRQLVLPSLNAANAALVPGARIIPCKHLLELTAWLHNQAELSEYHFQGTTEVENYADLAEIRGQDIGKRALEIAAAGGHNLLFSGPPGTGKTMLASRLPGILPSLSDREMLEILALRSLVSPDLSPAHCRSRPFRAPHHSATTRALVGGGGTPRPGEISLAHNGVLFLDELPEFPRQVLETLREPLESGAITISRLRQQITYPARFQLVAAMNPCPCGFAGDQRKSCQCTPHQILRYRKRLSGPLLDRIDLHVTLARPAISEFAVTGKGPIESTGVRKRVEGARQHALDRAGIINAGIPDRELDRHCHLESQALQILQRAGEQLDLSARAYQRVLRVARTIADLEQASEIDSSHLTEALGYRQSLSGLAG